MDATVLRIFGVAEAEGSGRYQQSDAARLLNQFKEEEKRQTYVDYVNCLLKLMGIATETSGLPPREVVLDSPVAVASLETVRRGQRFVLAPGETVAVFDHGTIFTVDDVDTYQDRRIVYFSWSNSETGQSGSKDYVYQSQLVDLGEKCSLTPYQIDVEGAQVSFLSNC